MRLLFNGDEPPGLRDTRDDRAEAGFDVDIAPCSSTNGLPAPQDS
jgi:hypothetical protein